MAEGDMVELDFAQCINIARSMIIENGPAPASKIATRSQAWSIPTMTRRLEPLKVPGKFSSLTADEIERKKALLNEKLGQIATLTELIGEFPEENRLTIQNKIDTQNIEVNQLRAELI